VPESPSAAIGAHLAGVPDSLPETWCAHCKVDVQPRGKGLCPRCGRFLRQSFAARKHPVNLARRDELHNENIAEYKPQTLHLRRACRWLANITERLEHVKDGTPEHQRLVDMWTHLTATLEASRTPTPDANPGVERMPQTALELARDLLQRLAAGETLSEREQGQLDVLDAAMRGELLLRGELVSDDPSPVVIDQAPAPPTADPIVQATVPTAAPAAAEPTCAYCHQSHERCAEIKATNLDAWQVLHYSDPTEVAKRDEEATAIMMKQMGKPSPWL
jgi:hypothetical protein